MKYNNILRDAWRRKKAFKKEKYPSALYESRGASSRRVRVWMNGLDRERTKIRR